MERTDNRDKTRTTVAIVLGRIVGTSLYCSVGIIEKGYIKRSTPKIVIKVWGKFNHLFNLILDLLIKK